MRCAHCILCGDRIQSGITYCVAFSASLAMLAGSGNNVGCDDRKNSGSIMKYARTFLS